MRVGKLMRLMVQMFRDFVGEPNFHNYINRVFNPVSDLEQAFKELSSQSKNGHHEGNLIIASREETLENTMDLSGLGYKVRNRFSIHDYDEHPIYLFLIEVHVN